MRFPSLLLLSIVLLCFYTSAKGQRFASEKTFVKFFSDALVEDIAAENTEARSLFDFESRKIAFSIPIKSFDFDKELMQTHFNENYMESEKYPKATFSGEVMGFSIDKEGAQNVSAKGDISIHGVTKNISVEGTMEKVGERLLLKAVFPVTLADFDVKIPKLLFQNIAEVVEVTLDFEYTEQKKAN